MYVRAIKTVQLINGFVVAVSIVVSRNASLLAWSKKVSELMLLFISDLNINFMYFFAIVNNTGSIV